MARVFLFATFMTVAASIPLLTIEWGLSGTAAGAIITSFTICYAVSLFIFAWATDHYGAKRMAIVSAILAAATSLLFGLVARDWWSAFLLYGLVGLAQGGVYTPLIVLFADEAPPGARGNAMGWLIRLHLGGLRHIAGRGGPGHRHRRLADGLHPLRHPADHRRGCCCLPS